MNFNLSHKFYVLIKFIIWICYAFFFLNVVNGGNDVEVVVGVLLCAVLIQMTLMTFINHWYKNKRPTLLDWFRLTTFFVIILNFFVLIKDLKHQNNFFGFIIRSEFILPSLFVILIALLGLKISEKLYLNFKPGSRKISQRIKVYEIRNVFFFYLFAIVLAFIQIYLILTGEVGYGTFQENTTSDYSFLFQIVFILSNFTLSLFAIFKYLYPNKKKGFTLVYVTYFLIQILYGFLSGMKESIITPFIIVLIPFLLSGRKISKNYIIFGTFALLFIYPINNNYRDLLIDFPNIKRQEALGIALVKTMDLSFSENVNKGSTSFSDRLSLFPYLVYSVEKEPEWNYYKNLDRYIYIPVAWIIPRFMLPDKPKSEIGGVLNEMVVGVDTNSLTPTTYGWAFFEGGFLYVFLLFLLLGLFINYFQYNLGFDNLLGILIYIQILVNMLKVESDIYFLISGILQTILICFLMIKILIKRNTI
jgi:hypothetical protein